MNYKNILEVADVIDNDFVETSLARALILKEVASVTLEEYHTLVHVNFKDGKGWVLPTATDKTSVQRRVTSVSTKGNDLIVPSSLVDKRWIPTLLDFTFIGDSARVGTREASPHYHKFSRSPEEFRTIPLYTKGYDPEGVHLLFLEWCKTSTTEVPEYDKRAIEYLLEDRPWFADLLALKGIVLQERVELGDSTVWESKGCIITAQLSKRRWGVLYRFGIAEGAATYLTACSANSYFTPEFDDGCSRGDAQWHFFKALLADRMVPFYQATRKGSQS